MRKYNSPEEEDLYWALVIGIHGREVEEVREALERGADPNVSRDVPELGPSPENYEEIPLVFTPCYECIALLVKFGADVNSQDSKGRFAIHYLLEEYINLEYRDPPAYTDLGDYRDAIQELLEAGSNPMLGVEWPADLIDIKINWIANTIEKGTGQATGSNKARRL